MNKYIRDNSKKILAVVSVALMVAWAIPNRNSGGQNGKRLIGRIGDEKVFDSQLSLAKEQWDFLEDAIMLSPEQTGGGEVSLVQAVRQQDPPFKELADQMTVHPELFLLLQREAERMGVFISDAKAENFVKQSGLAIRLMNSNRAIVDYDAVTDPNYKAAALDAVKAYLRVRESLTRAAYTLKISKPMRDHALERQLEEIQVSAVQFTANDFLAKINPATPEQLQEQFNRYADVLPDAPSSADNPHGFGYKNPNRVTLQYIGVRHDDAVNAVRATKSAYLWDVDAEKYYLKNQNLFVDTSSATKPASQPSTNPATMASAGAPTTAPVTKPFAEVRQDILNKLMAPDIARRAQDAQDRIKTQLAADWKTWSAKHASATSMPTTSPADPVAKAPTTSSFTPGDYGSYEYLQRLADDVDKHTGIRPVIAAINQYQGPDDLKKLPGIGESAITFNTPLPFSEYAPALSADIAPLAARGAAPVLKLFQPSPIARSSDGSTYMYRLTGAQPASRPESMSDVAAAVERDDRIARAYAMAKKQAEELQHAAAANGSLASAAISAGLKPAVSGMFDDSATKIDGLDLDAKEVPRFRQEAFGLLSIPATQPSAPAIKLIELPLTEKIEVTQLMTAKPRADISSVALYDGAVEQELLRESVTPVLMNWFDYNSVVRRMNWKDESGRTKNEPTDSEPPSTPPAGAPPL